MKNFYLYILFFLKNYYLIFCSIIYINNSKVYYMWDTYLNNGHIGDTVIFSWTNNLLNVIQVENHTDHSFHNWPGELNSGTPVENGTWIWHITDNFRPGIYHFSAEGKDMGCLIVVNLISNYTQEGTGTTIVRPPFSCSEISSNYPPNCTVYEFSHFIDQYDWYPPFWTAKQGDLILWTWSNLDNVVQVDGIVSNDEFCNTNFCVGWNGGISSGPKYYCVPGVNKTCINNPPGNGQFIWDTTGYRPGIYHFSVEGVSGTQSFVDLRLAKPMSLTSSCCVIPADKRTANYDSNCTVWEIANWNVMNSCGPYCWHPYFTFAKQWDIVRWRWSGNHSVYQVNGTSSEGPETVWNGGLTSGPPILCVPGANMSCLNTNNAEFIWEIKDTPPGTYYFYGYPALRCIVIVNAYTPPVNATPLYCPTTNSCNYHKLHFILSFLIICLLIKDI